MFLLFAASTLSTQLVLAIIMLEAVDMSDSNNTDTVDLDRRLPFRTFSVWCLRLTLPPERTQPKKLCTANFSSGTLKTLIDRPLWLKNKIF